MFNELNDDTVDVERQLGDLQRRRRAADAVQVRRQLRGAHARLPVAPLPLHSDHDAEGRRRQPAVRQPAPAGGALRRRATSARRSGSTRRRGRPTPTTASRRRPSGYGMVDIAIAARTRLIAGARVERFDQTVTTQDPFGLFAREVQAANKNTDVFPAVNFVQGVGDELEPPAELQHDGQPAGVPRAGRVRVHRRRRQPRRQGQRRT